MRSTLRAGLVALLLTLAVPAAVATHERSQNAVEVTKAPAAVQPSSVAAIAPSVFVASALQAASVQGKLESRADLRLTVTRQEKEGLVSGALVCAFDSTSTRRAPEAPVAQTANPPSSTIHLRSAIVQRPSLTPRFEQLLT